MKPIREILANMTLNASILPFLIPFIMLLTGCVGFEPYLNSEVFLTPEMSESLSRKIKQNVACVAGRQRLNSPQDKPPLKDYSFYVFLSGKPSLKPAQIKEDLKEGLKGILGESPKKIEIVQLTHVSGTERSFSCQELMKMQDQS